MRTIIIKNVDTVDHTYAGQLIVAGESYTIQSEYERQQFAKDTSLNQDIWDATAKAVVNDGSADLSAADGDSWLKGTSTDPKDSDGAPLTRAKITKSGWHFLAHTVEFETSKLNSLYSKDVSGTDIGFASIKYYDNTDTELVAGTQAELDTSCVKTVMEWEPDHDYEIIGGTLYQSQVPTSNVRIWILAVPDIPANLGGCVPFADGGLNLKHMGTGPVMELDGKTPKLMAYDPVYHTNKFQITVKHDVGDVCPLMVVFKVFEA